MTGVTAGQWWAGGRSVELSIGGVPRQVFVRDEGAGPCLTLLHGYPASSLEWAGVWPALTEGHRVVTLDFLGHGASDKPAGHSYPLDEQAELVEAVWSHLDIAATAVVAYDYGAIITQILQTRRAPITAITYLNASLYPELYRPRPIQRLAPLPIVGAAVWRRFDERAFHRTWAAVFGSEHPLGPELAHEHWTALTRNDPRATASRAVLSYIRQRARRSDQLTATLAAATPTQFLWGSADPVSGRLTADALRHRLGNPNLTEYPGVGHVPHLEIPDQIAEAIMRHS
jgi:pimeloyl-ACP methyl ester carboxylesterase